MSDTKIKDLCKNKYIYVRYKIKSLCKNKYWEFMSDTKLKICAKIKVCVRINIFMSDTKIKDLCKNKY